MGSTLSSCAVLGYHWYVVDLAMALGAKAGVLPTALLGAYAISSVIVLQWAGVSFAFLHLPCVCFALQALCVSLSVAVLSRVCHTCSWGAGQADAFRAWRFRAGQQDRCF